MTFLLMLLLIFFYIFAVTGVYFFQDYSRSTIEDLEYNMFFSRQNLSPESVRRMVQGKPSEDLLEPSKGSGASDAENTDAEGSDAEESDASRSGAENTDAENTGAENTDAENTDAENTGAEDTGAEDTGAEDTGAEESDADAKKGQKASSKAKVYPSSTSSSSYGSSVVDFDFIDNLDWETLVHENLPGLMDMEQDDRVVWPRDSLFRYFELLEKLQYNLEERKKLQEFAG